MTGMADKVTVLLRLPVPEGRIGDVVTVSSARAQMLVDSKYATFVSLADDADDEAPASSSDEPTDTSEEQPPAPVGADGPATELPAKSAAKAE